MSPQATPPWISPLRAAAALVLAAVTVTAAAGCGSSSAPAPAAQASSSLQQDCTAVTDALANGPDPDADSVGYAEAQVLPLGQLTLSDPAVRSAVEKLDAAYKAFSSAEGSAQSKDAVTVSTTEKTLNTLCPGAAP